MTSYFLTIAVAVLIAALVGVITTVTWKIVESIFRLFCLFRAKPSLKKRPKMNKILSFIQTFALARKLRILAAKALEVPAGHVVFSDEFSISGRTYRMSVERVS